MVAFKSFALGALAIAAGAQARITSFYAPSTAVAGQNISVQLANYLYIQNWDDFGAIFGLDNPELNCQACLGLEIGFIDLYKQNWHANKTFSIHIPEGANGTYALKVGIPYLVGASGGTGIRYFNQTLVVQPE